MQVVLYCGVGGDVRLLSTFIQHYKSLGITRALISLHLRSEDHSLVDHVSAAASAAGGDLANVWVDSCLNHKRRRQERLKVLDRFCSPSDWVINADIDEFHEYPGGLHNIIDICGREQFDYVRGYLCDRIAADGTLPVLNPRRLWEQFPLEAELSKNVLEADVRKIPISKSSVAISGGYHESLDVHARACPETHAYVKVHHFKWDSSVTTRLEDRIRLMKSENAPWWRESERFLTYVRNNAGRINIRDEKLNARISTYTDPAII